MNSINPDFNNIDTTIHETFTDRVLGVVNKIQKKLNFMQSQRILKPKLYMHIGPMKTATTTLQINIVENPNMQEKLKLDGFQIINYPYRRLTTIFERCFFPDELDKNKNCSIWDDELMEVFNESYSNAMNKSNAINSTLHSQEIWTFIRRSYFEKMKEMFGKWEVHFILFYRPFLDWLPSRYAHYRKYFIANPNMQGYFRQDYFVMRHKQKALPQYLTYSQDKTTTIHSLRDLLSIYEICKDFLVYLGEKVPVNNIHMLQTYSPIIEEEFICKLPNATKSCSYVKSKRKWKKRNEAPHSPFLNLDLVIVEAWYQKLVSIGRHDAELVLKRQMEESHITFNDLPLVCLSDKQEDWIWNRMIRTDMVFSEEKLTLNDLVNQFENAISSKRFCSVNATAALQVKKFRKLFDHCDFQSPFYRHRNGRTNTSKINPKWKELAC